MLKRVVRIARQAGKAILKYYRDDAVGVTYKEDASPLTEADLAAHRVIVRGLRQLTPRIPVISEEADLPPFVQRRRWQRFWLVDPLDGTKEFLKHNGEFTVNIALIDRGKPVLGVVYAPALGLIYYAQEGKGAWKKAKSKPTRRIYAKAIRPGQAVVVLESRSHGDGGEPLFLKKYRVAKKKRVGSSLKFCYVADGRAHVYPRLGPTMEWDVAAGDAVFRFASRTRVNPSPLTYNKRSLKNKAFVIAVVAEKD